MAEIVVVHGYAGSGKSTQCEKLAELKYAEEPIAHVSAGNRLRAIRTGVEDSKLAARIISWTDPSPLPDEIVNEAMFESINTTAAGLFLIDGYPRHPSAINMFRGAVRASGHSLRGCINLTVSEEVSVERILGRGQRPGERLRGDSLEAYARWRYQEDTAKTQATVDYLGASIPVELVAADTSVELVTPRFIAALGNLGLHINPPDSEHGNDRP